MNSSTASYDYSRYTHLVSRVIDLGVPIKCIDSSEDAVWLSFRCQGSKWVNLWLYDDRFDKSSSRNNHFTGWLIVGAMVEWAKQHDGTVFGFYSGGVSFFSKAEDKEIEIETSYEYLTPSGKMHGGWSHDDFFSNAMLAFIRMFDKSAHTDSSQNG